MVGHEVEDQAEIVSPERIAETHEAGLAAELGVELIMVDDVIAMGRACARLQERGGIEMTDAERLQVRHNFDRGVEVKRLGELQTISCDRDRWRHSLFETPAHRPGRQAPGQFAAPYQGSLRGAGNSDVAIGKIGREAQAPPVPHPPVCG